MNTSIRKFLVEEDGVTALEYGILAALVASALAVVFGSSFQTLFNDLFDKVKTSAGVATGGNPGDPPSG